jgi:hypothetical protein
VAVPVRLIMMVVVQVDQAVVLGMLAEVAVHSLDNHKL